MADDRAYALYGEQYIELLSSLLETDADIAAELYQLVLSPHMTKEFQNSMQTNSYNKDFGSVTRQNEHLTGEDEANARISLARLDGKRQDALIALKKCGAIAAWERDEGKDAN